MSDLISRQEAMDTLKMDYTIIPYKKAQEYVKATLDEIWDRLNKLPTAVPERPKGKWIPCSERLPETHEAGDSFVGIFMQSEPVLVYGVPESESEYSFNVATYCDDLNGITYWSTEMDAVTINKVTAWMPLPEPYQEGEQDD